MKSLPKSPPKPMGKQLPAWMRPPGAPKAPMAKPPAGKGGAKKK